MSGVAKFGEDMNESTACSSCTYSVKALV